MSPTDTVEVLNRVLTILWRSFPQYMRYARPYIPTGEERALETLDQIVAGQDALAERVHEQLIQAGALPDTPAFPMEFTDTHDLGLDYLIRNAIGYQQQDIAELQSIADSLHLAPAAKALAEEALGMAKGHLESLEELAAERKSAAS